jgi:hypothetical protein
MIVVDGHRLPSEKIAFDRVRIPQGLSNELVDALKQWLNLVEATAGLRVDKDSNGKVFLPARPQAFYSLVIMVHDKDTISQTYFRGFWDKVILGFLGQLGMGIIKNGANCDYGASRRRSDV